jgi:hypothetical protein
MLVTACSDFLPTAADRNRCHLCHQPKHAHPYDYDAVYWSQWLIFAVLLELEDNQNLPGLMRRQAC